MEKIVDYFIDWFGATGEDPNTMSNSAISDAKTSGAEQFPDVPLNQINSAFNQACNMVAMP